jgi:signal transduction protein with GAF and PtsI domain
VTDPEGGEPFDEEDLALLRILAAQIAGLIKANAETLDAAVPEAPLLETDLAAEEAVDRGDAELARIICDAATAEVEPQRILRAAVHAVGDRLRASPVSIYLLENGELVRQSEHDGGLRSDRATLPLARGLTGTVAETGQLVACDQPSSDPRFDDLVDTPEDGVASPLLCGPLRFRGKTLGVYRVFPEEGVVPSAETGEVLTAALSAAVRNVLLYRSLVETIEEVARARREAQA